MSADVLSDRALNRALLDRQWLLARRPAATGEALEHLVGLQGQTPNSPYIALWSRIEGFDPQSLADMVTGRTAVRLPLMRSTIHLVTAADCLALRPPLQPVLERVFQSQSPYGRATAGVDGSAVIEAAQAFLDERPCTHTELAALLGERFPGADAKALAYRVQYLLPVVQTPPRGTWFGTSQATWTTVERWLGTTFGGGLSVDELVLRYLRAYGPASPRDASAWCGLARLGEAFERLRPSLRTYRDERGLELFDIADILLPDADTPAPVRFLPDYENAILGFAERRRIVPERTGPAMSLRAELTVGSILVDGLVEGVWKIQRERKAAALLIQSLSEWTAARRLAVEAEGAALIEFAAATVETREVRFTTIG